MPTGTITATTGKGEPIAWQGSRPQLMQSLKSSMGALAAEVGPRAWE